MEWIKGHFRNLGRGGSAQRALEGYRLGVRAGGAIRGVRIIVGPASCPACRALAGRIYHVDEVPPIPNPGCTSPAGCRCAYRPVMTYDE